MVVGVATPAVLPRRILVRLMVAMSPTRIPSRQRIPGGARGSLMAGATAMVIEEKERVGPVTPSADAAIVVRQGLATVAVMIGPAFPRAKASANATA